MVKGTIDLAKLGVDTQTDLAIFMATALPISVKLKYQKMKMELGLIDNYSLTIEEKSKLIAASEIMMEDANKYAQMGIGMVTGTVEAFINTLNPVKQYNYMFNTNLTLHEAIEHDESAIQVTLTVLGGIKLKNSIVNKFKKWTNVSVSSKGILDAFRKNADPFKDVMGSGTESHPIEWNKLITEMESAGVEIVYRDGGMAYSPSTGKRGQIIIDKSSSYGALLHEYTHYLDDVSKGFPGMEYHFQTINRVKMELHAYMQEIKLADSLGYKSVANQLFQNYMAERNILTNYLRIKKSN